MALVPNSDFEIKKLISDVLDASSFVETLSLVRGKSSLGEAAGEGVVSGFGMINDIRVGVFGTIHEVLLGGIGKKTAKKISHIVDSAVKVNAPVVGFIDSEGARFAEGIKALEGYAGIIESFTSAYGRVPVILIVTGADYGMLSYLSSFCDVCIAMPKARIASSSPLLLASTSKIDAKEVANIKIHTSQSGIITNTAENSSQLKQQITEVLDLLTVADIPTKDDPNRTSKKLVEGSDAREVITQAFDESKFFELREDFGKEVITGFSRLNGRAVGIVANNKSINQGRITSSSAYKITALISICSNFGLPIVNIVDCAGIINDLNDENYDLIRSVSDMLFAYNVCDCAKVSLISGQAIGIGYTAFANKRTFDYSIAWKGASVGMLDDTQTATLLYSDVIGKAKDKEAATKELSQAYGNDNSIASIVAESGYIDNVIDPAHTRLYLISAVQAFADKR